VNSANDARIEIEDALSTPPAEAVPGAARTRNPLLAWIVAAITTLVFAPIAILHIREKPAAEPAEMRLEINTPSTSAPLEFALSPEDGTSFSSHPVTDRNGSGCARWTRPRHNR